MSGSSHKRLGVSQNSWWTHWRLISRSNSLRCNHARYGDPCHGVLMIIRVMGMGKRRKAVWEIGFNFHSWAWDSLMWCMFDDSQDFLLSCVSFIKIRPERLTGWFGPRGCCRFSMCQMFRQRVTVYGCHQHKMCCTHIRRMEIKNDDDDQSQKRMVLRDRRKEQIKGRKRRRNLINFIPSQNAWEDERWRKRRQDMIHKRKEEDDERNQKRGEAIWNTKVNRNEEIMCWIHKKTRDKCVMRMSCFMGHLSSNHIIKMRMMHNGIWSSCQVR